MVAGMAKVVELAVDMVAKSDAQLRADVAVAPDSTSEEQVIESTSATQFNAETTLLETWGKSSYTTGRSSIAASASVSGSGFGFSASVSAFGGSAADKQEGEAGAGENSATSRLGRKTTEYHMSRYYWEPRLRLNLEPHMLTATAPFADDVAKLEHMNCLLNRALHPSSPSSCHENVIKAGGVQPPKCIAISYRASNLKKEDMIQQGLEAPFKNALAKTVLFRLRLFGVEDGAFVDADVQLPRSGGTGPLYESLQVQVLVQHRDETRLTAIQNALDVDTYLRSSLLEAMQGVPGIDEAFSDNAAQVQISDFSIKEEDMADSAADVSGARDPLKQKQELDQRIDDTFSFYGTHVCPQAVLGAWWKAGS